MKNIGYRFLIITGYFVLLGGLFDIAMTFYSSTLPTAHLSYLKLNDEVVPVELKSLHKALLGAIGGCLIAIGLGTLTIVHIGIKSAPKPSIIRILSMITIAEGINAIQLYLISSPYFVFPLLCVTLTWVGTLIWFFGKDSRLK
jgi:hypothetical protein